MPEVTYILKSDFWDAMPSQRSLTLSHVTYGTPCHAQRSLTLSHVTYGTPCHTRGHLHSYLGKQKISLEVVIILGHVLANLG